MRVRPSSLCVVALGLSLLACDVAEPGQPSGSSVAVLVRDPEALASQHAVRAAVVWISRARSPDGGAATVQAEVTTDQPLAIDPNGDETQVTLPLGLPSPRAQARLYPVELLALVVRDDLGDDEVVPIHRPRIVAYADNDSDGRFDLASADDLVLAVDSGPVSVAAVLELPDALAGLSLDATDVLYRATAGRYTPFLRARPFSRLADGQSLFVVSSSTRPLRLVLGRSPIAAADVRCGRTFSAVLDSDLQFSLPTSSDERAIFVDVAIDAASLCAAAGSNCSAVNLDAIDPPEIRSPAGQDGSLHAYCRAWGDLEALWVVEREVACDGCECGLRRVTRAYVVRSDAPPAWWPCGSALPFCETDAPAFAPADC